MMTAKQHPTFFFLLLLNLHKKELQFCKLIGCLIHTSCMNEEPKQKETSSIPDIGFYGDYKHQFL